MASSKANDEYLVMQTSHPLWPLMHILIPLETEERDRNLQAAAAESLKLQLQ